MHIFEPGQDPAALRVRHEHARISFNHAIETERLFYDLRTRNFKTVSEDKKQTLLKLYAPNLLEFASELIIVDGAEVWVTIAAVPFSPVTTWGRLKTE